MSQAERSVGHYVEVMKLVNYDLDLNLSPSAITMLAGMLFDAYQLGKMTGQQEKA